MIKFIQSAPLYIDECTSTIESLLGSKPSHEQLIAHLAKSETRKPGDTSFAVCMTEFAWTKRRRPFLNVYPSIVRSLSNTTLALKPSQIPASVINELGILCVKLPLGIDKPKLLKGITHFFIQFSNRTANFNNRAVVEECSYSFSFHDSGACFYFCATGDDTFEIADAKIPNVSDIEDNIETPGEHDRRLCIARIGLGIALLASDPEFITPIVLAADRNKQGDIERYAQKARQRGVIGYEIGKDIECSPHVRRPHFAIRWTGKNGSVPKLVPVKGSIVNRHKLGEIPTGYEEEVSA